MNNNLVIQKWYDPDLYETANAVTTINAGIGAWSWQGKFSPLTTFINAGIGGWTWVGKASPLSTIIPATKGSYTWVGKTSPLSTMINATKGAYSWSGKNSPLSTMINATKGAYSWNGTTATIVGQLIIPATIGAYSWRGTTATVVQIITINAQIGVYSWVGKTAQVATSATPSKGLAHYGVSFRRKRSQMDEVPDLDVRSSLQEVLIQKGLIERAEFTVNVKPVSQTEEEVEVKVSGISKRDLEAIIIALLASEL